MLPFDCGRKRFSGFYRFYGFSGEGAAQKIMKRRGVLIALRAVVISSVVERSFLHCGQYHIGTAGKRRLGAAHILCLSVCMEDFSLALEMTIRESEVF